MFSPVIHRFIFMFGICSLAVGMVFGTISTSVPQMILGANWLLEGNFKAKLNSLKGNKVFWILFAVFFMHIVGLIHTTNIASGLDDIRIKLPLFILPFVLFSSSPLNKRELHAVLFLFVAGVVFSLFWCLIYNATHVLPDVRKISRFMSHIRLGLFITMAICVLVYFIVIAEKMLTKVVATSVIVFLLWFMVKFSIVTGLFMFSISSVLFLVYVIIKQNVKIKLLGFSLLVLGALTAGWFINKEWEANNFVDTSPANTPKKESAGGHPYFPVKNTWQTENGFYVAYNIQYEELYRNWPLISNKPIFGNDKKNNPVLWTLLRYMSSKGLTKDSAGLKQMNADDIQNVENGITNYKYINASALKRRVKEFILEYKNYKYEANPTGNTMLMRFEFWKAALYIIERNPVFGVGTGDVQKSFDKAYYRTNTQLSHEWRLRSHNQFLAITVAFGMVGLLVFLMSILYPTLALRKNLHGLYYMFLVIAVVSFFTEDTLESQAGVTFYAYFNTFFLWLAFRNEETREF